MAFRHAVFVYGTLKRGLPNHTRYLAVAETRGGAKCIGEATTCEKFSLTILPSGTRAPILMRPLTEKEKEMANHIKGEIYEIDDYTLEALDLIEGVTTGKYYYKDYIRVELNCTPKKLLICAAYLFPYNAEYMNLRQFPDYNEIAQAEYKPKDVNTEVLSLCKGLSRKLTTKSQVPCVAHVLRLLPGEDIIHSLRNFCRNRKIESGAIVSCVGSTSQATLRPAGKKEPFIIDEKCEILSLSGTISSSGHHLHLCVGDPKCAVFGGHALYGCIVRTTAEIVIGEFSNVVFERRNDPRTGYDELFILED